jgi:hypothetical protein
MEKTIKIENYKGFHWWILVLFAVLEVLFYKSDNALQLPVTILEYLFVLYAFFKNREIGILYFFSFVLLSFGSLNYIDTDLPFSFWGIRIGGFSVSILFSVLLSAILFFEKKDVFLIKPKNIFERFLVFLIISGLIIGFIRCLQGINYIDNFFRDVLTYTPVIFYMPLLSVLSIKNCFHLLKTITPVSVVMLLLAIIMQKNMLYGGISFIAVCVSIKITCLIVLIWKREYKSWLWYLMLCIVLFSIFSGSFMSGIKFWIMLFLTVVFYWMNKNKIYTVLVILLIVSFLIFFEPIIQFVQNTFFQDNGVIMFKFEELKSGVLNLFTLSEIAGSYGSMGNMFSELLTVWRHLLENFSILLFGEGFGGGVPDYYGWLQDGAGNTGYALIDARRDNYFKMHLPINEIPLKGGLILLIFYFACLIKLSRIKSQFNIGILFFISFFMLFYVDKENLLLALILAKIAEYERLMSRTESSGKSALI